MIMRLEARKRKRAEEEDWARGHVAQLNQDLEGLIQSLPSMELRIGDIQAENEADAAARQQAIQQYEVARTKELSDQELRAEAAHRARMSTVAESRHSYEAERVRRLDAAREVVRERTEAVVNKYTPLVLHQTDARAAAATLLNSCDSRQKHLQNEMAMAKSRHEKLVAEQESQFSAARTKEKKQLEDLARSAQLSERAMTIYVNDMDRRRRGEEDALGLEEADLTVEGERVEAGIEEMLQTRADTRESDVSALRSRFGSRKQELEARKRELLALFAKAASNAQTARDRAATPMDHASLALQALESEIEARQDILDEEVVAIKEYELEVEARIQAEVEGLQNLVHDLQTQASARVATLRREHEAERLRLTNDRDTQLREIDVKAEILQNKIDLLQTAAGNIREEAKAQRAQSQQLHTKYEGRMKDLRRSTRADLEDDIGEIDYSDKATFDDRATHRLASIGILTEQVKQHDLMAPADAMEHEARKLDIEVDFLTEDMAALKHRRARIDALFARRLESREVDARLTEESVLSDAEDMQKSLERIVDLKKVQLRISLVDRKSRLEASRAKLVVLREEGIRQTRILDRLAYSMDYEIRRVNVREELKELRKIEVLLGALTTEEQAALSDLRSRQAQEELQVKNDVVAKRAEMELRRANLASKRQHLARQVEGWDKHAGFLTKVHQQAKAEHQAAAAKAHANEEERKAAEKREEERWARAESVLNGLLAEIHKALVEAGRKHKAEAQKLEDLEGEYRAELARAEDLGPVKDVEAWCKQQEDDLAAAAKASETRRRTDHSEIGRERDQLQEELRNMAIELEKVGLGSQPAGVERTPDIGLTMGFVLCSPSWRARSGCCRPGWQCQRHRST